MTKILGPSFASILEKEHTRTDILSVVSRVKEANQEKDGGIKVKLFQLLQNMDNQVLSNCLQEISK